MERQSDRKKRVLLVSQTFPPAKGIGGRRWAKFAGCLSQNQVELEIISAEMSKDPAQAWLEDVREIPQYHYAHRFPKILTKIPRSFFQKIRYRLELTKAKLKADGTPYDRAIYDEKPFLELLAARLTKFQPDALIVTAPPFNLLVYSAKLREHFSEITFIADLRDPWIDGNLYGYGGLMPQSFKVEEAKERLVVENFDLILSPWEMVINGFSERYKDSLSKFKILSHAWDKKDLKPSVQLKEKYKIDLIYGGNLYKGFEPFLNFLNQFAEANGVKVEIYANTYLPENVANRKGQMRLMSSIPVSDFFTKIAESRRLLMLIPEGIKNGFPTKLLEFAATGKQIIAVGFEGTLSQLIVSKGLGIFVKLEEIELEFKNAYYSIPKNPKATDWVNSMELELVTKRLIKLINIKPS